jgi:hypothetical protein
MKRTTSERGTAVCVRSAVAVPRTSYDVILVSSTLRCPLRGRHRTPATTG